ncbi:hypothetical protein lbkm_2401 [Lachnospiraceae bacterium KM106-2]|nr:hypothetical protein lbkm_2401 [Lachnospiraceae bacterium KM106-2]
MSPFTVLLYFINLVYQSIRHISTIFIFFPIFSFSFIQ